MKLNHFSESQLKQCYVQLENVSQDTSSEKKNADLIKKQSLGKCIFCGKTFSKHVLAGHMRTKHNKPFFCCPFARCYGIFFASEQEIKHHLEMCHVQNSDEKKCIECV
jgi:hypothetical protein